MRAFLGVITILSAVTFTAAAEVKIEKVFGEELPGKYKHPACIEELDNGDLYLAYYGGSGEYTPDTAVYGARLRKGETTWGKPAVIADTPFHSDGNPVVWQAPDGIVWLFHVVRYGDTWSDSRIHVKISRDGANTWSDPFIIADERGMMVRAQPIVLNSGEYLLPIYHETGHDREFVAEDTTSLFLRCDPKTMTWTESSRITAGKGCLQPSVVQIDDNYLVTYMRRGGGYDAVTDGYLIRSESHDGGKTWAPGQDSKFKNPNAAADFIKLQNGRLLLVYNDSMTDRNPLTVSISTDNDKTYAYTRNIVEGDDDFAYPYAIQTRDAKIHVIFTSKARTQINHAIFEESDITGVK